MVGNVSVLSSIKRMQDLGKCECEYVYVFIICITIALNYSNHFCKWALFSTLALWLLAGGTKHLLSVSTEKHLSAEPLSTNTGAVILGLGNLCYCQKKGRSTCSGPRRAE